MKISKLLLAVVAVIALVIIGGVAVSRIAPQIGQNVTPTPLACAKALPLIQKAAPVCGKVGRDQICYGIHTVKVDFADSAQQVAFSNPGDIAPLTAFKSVSTERRDLDNGELGLAIFKLQAHLPMTTAGQAVTFVLYGDSTFGQKNGAQAALEPTEDTNKDIATLGDSGAFYFTTNIGTNAACKSISPSGLIVQNPRGTKVQFSVNGAQLTIGSTVLIQMTTNTAMTVSVIEGQVDIAASNVQQTIPAGYEVTVPLNASQEAGAPSTPTRIGRSLQFQNCNLVRSAGMNTACVVIQASSQGTSSSNSGNGQQTGANGQTTPSGNVNNPLCRIVPVDGVVQNTILECEE